MAIRKVARLGHPVLRRVADPIPPDQITSAEVQRLVADLRDTMAEYAGVGLAAPQIFEPLRVFVMLEAVDTTEPNGVKSRIWINPELKPAAQDRADGWEGCLSIPDLRGLVPRHTVVDVHGYDEHGVYHEVRYEGFPAIVAQHEYDHLDGIVFLDRMVSMQSLSFLKEFERYMTSEEEDEAS